MSTQIRITAISGSAAMSIRRGILVLASPGMVGIPQYGQYSLSSGMFFPHFLQYIGSLTLFCLI